MLVVIIVEDEGVIVLALDVDAEEDGVISPEVDEMVAVAVDKLSCGDEVVPGVVVSCLVDVSVVLVEESSGILLEPVVLELDVEVEVGDGVGVIVTT